MTEVMLDKQMIQMVTKPTRIIGPTGSLLDHIYIKKRSVHCDIVTRKISDHLAIICNIEVAKAPNDSKIVTKGWFTNEKYYSLALLLGDEDWSPMDSMNTDEASEFLDAKIIANCDLIAPIESKTLRDKRINQWTTKGITTSLKISYILYRATKKKEGEEKQQAVRKYKNYKIVLTKVRAKSKSLYYTKTLSRRRSGAYGK